MSLVYASVGLFLVSKLDVSSLIASNISMNPKLFSNYIDIIRKVLLELKTTVQCSAFSRLSAEPNTQVSNPQKNSLLGFLKHVFSNKHCIILYEKDLPVV